MAILAMDVIKLLKESTEENAISIGNLVSSINDTSQNLRGTPPDISEDVTSLIGNIMEWCDMSGVSVVTPGILMKFLSGKYDMEYTESLRMFQHIPNPALIQYGSSLTSDARMGKLPVVINRDVESEECLRILSHMKKNSVILTGNDGYGKTTIVYGLAQRLAAYDAPTTLQGKEIYTINTKALVDGAMYRGQIESRISRIASIAIRQEYILFLDTISDATTQLPGESNTILGILEPYIVDHGLRIIGVATPDTYHNLVRRNPRVGEHFQRVKVELPEDQCLVKMLELSKVELERYHSVSIPEDITKEAIRLTRRNIPHGSIDTMIDILDSSSIIASGRGGIPTLPASVQEWKERILDEDFLGAALSTPRIVHTPKEPVPVSTTDLVKAIADSTGKEVFSSDTERLESLEDKLNDVIINQKDQISDVCKLIRTASVFQAADKPLASLLFIGVPGCGKTYLAQTLAKVLFSDEILVINMENYRERFTVSRLLGSPPGYVGYDEGGILPNWIREHPSSVILFDEIEKAHEDVYNILLGMMDQGQITDMQGTTTGLGGSLILMTSNIGSRHITEGYKYNLGFGGKSMEKDDEVDVDVREQFSPAFLDRLSGQIKFNKLTKNDIRKVMDLELDKVGSKMEGLIITVTDAAKDIILEEWKDNDGARGVSRLINNHILDPISSLVIKDKDIRKVRVSQRGGKLQFRTA